MEKEGTEVGLEQRLKSVRNLCGRRIHVFDAISDLDGVKEIREAVPYSDKSGTMRADVREAFSLSMHSLIKAAKACFGQPVVDLDAVKAELIPTHPDEDPFLNLLNAKKFDGIYETAGERVKRDQYREIKESYFDDREAVIMNVYNQMLVHEKTAAEKPGRLRLLHGLAVTSTALLLALTAYAVIGSIYGISMFKKEKQSLEQGMDMKERAYIYQFYEFADKIDPPKDEKDREKKRVIPLPERVMQVLQVYEKRLIAQGETRYREVSAEDYKRWGDDFIRRLENGEVDFDKIMEAYFKKKMEGK
ncbi:hypothetical protein KY310_00230 [Candidatus Woesearchaeota archaeon]|nr:hypothetical protein [Candidatus Woesearchaeota archaeon]